MPHTYRQLWGGAKAQLSRIFSPFKSMPLTLSVVILLMLGIVFYMWENQVLSQEKGQYSPFQSGLSLFDYILMIVIGNFIISIAAARRDRIWIILPLIASLLFLILTIHYLIIILRFD